MHCDKFLAIMGDAFGSWAAFGHPYFAQFSWPFLHFFSQINILVMLFKKPSLHPFTGPSTVFFYVTLTSGEKSSYFGLCHNFSFQVDFDLLCFVPPGDSRGLLRAA